MKLEHVQVTVALERMWIYARHLSTTQKDNESHALMSGHAITYEAYDNTDKFIGRTRVEPEDWPVTCVTETTF